MSAGALARVEHINMTLEELIKLVKEKNARIVNIMGTPVIEVEEKHVTKRIIVSNIVFERDRIKERTVDGREKIYLVSPSRILRPTAQGGEVVKTWMKP
jgi:hypothetical protein